jgi:uncharacterized protein YgbK (DUF1537 family)
MVTRYLIADDMTGALEAGAAYLKAGRSVCVPSSLRIADTVPCPWSAEVIVLSTETRNCDPEVAAQRLRQALAIITRGGGTLAYKKIDSTLRGPLSAELGAVLAARPDLRLLVTPANPAAGRTVVDGELLVKGWPVTETPFAREMLAPVTDSRVMAVAAVGHEVVSGYLSLTIVRAGPRECAKQMRAAFDRGKRLLFADAETEADLLCLVEATQAMRGVLLVGSGGLAQALAQSTRKTAVGLPEVQTPGGPCLFLCGSVHPANLVQAEMLRDEAGFELVEVDAEAALRDRDAGDSYRAEIVRRALAALRGPGIALVQLRLRRGASLLPGEDQSDAARQLLDFLGDTFATLDRDCPVSRLFVTGGETAREVCSRLSGQWLRLCRELEPGVVGAELSTPTGTRLLAAKPGGFGHAGTMLQAYQWLSDPQSFDQPQNRGTLL